MELIVDMDVFLKEELESQDMLEVIMVMKKIIMEKEKLCLDMPILFLGYGLKPFINLYGGNWNILFWNKRRTPMWF